MIFVQLAVSFLLFYYYFHFECFVFNYFKLKVYVRLISILFLFLFFSAFINEFISINLMTSLTENKLYPGSSRSQDTIKGLGLSFNDHDY